MDLSPMGWVATICGVLLFLSLFLGQSQNKAVFNLANAMTLIGVLGLAIAGVVFYFR